MGNRLMLHGALERIQLIQFAAYLMVLASCASGSPGASSVPAPKSALKEESPAQAPPLHEAEPDEDPWLSLLSVPAAPPQAPEPAEPPPPPEPEPTFGTCVGKPSLADTNKKARYLCCYTPPSYYQQRVRLKWPEFKACYQAALERNPKTQGRVVAKFTIEEDGSVRRACDNGSTVGDSKLVECVLNVMTTVSFDSYTIGDPCPAVTLMYPLQFSPEAVDEKK